jgi:hypothetical protein
MSEQQTELMLTMLRNIEANQQNNSPSILKHWPSRNRISNFIVNSGNVPNALTKSLNPSWTKAPVSRLLL